MLAHCVGVRHHNTPHNAQQIPQYHLVELIHYNQCYYQQRSTTSTSSQHHFYHITTRLLPQHNTNSTTSQYHFHHITTPLLPQHNTTSTTDHHHNHHLLPPLRRQHELIVYLQVFCSNLHTLLYLSYRQTLQVTIVVCIGIYCAVVLLSATLIV